MVVPGRFTTTRTTLELTSSMRSQLAEPCRRVSADDQVQLDAGPSGLELGHGVGGVGGPAPLDLDAARLEPLDTFDGRLDQRQTVGGRRDGPACPPSATARSRRRAGRRSRPSSWRALTAATR